MQWGDKGIWGKKVELQLVPGKWNFLKMAFLMVGTTSKGKGYAELKPSHEVNDGEIQQESRQGP